MKVHAGWLTGILLLLPIVAGAQTITGSVEGSAGTGSSTSDGQVSQNNALWQGYTLGFSSPIINPKLIRLNTEVSFRAGRLNFSAPGNELQGTQRDLGYKLGANLFPAGHFPFSIQATRDNVAETGDYPSTDGIHGGIVVPPGEPAPDFRTVNTALNMGWQLAVPALPHVSVGYRKGSSVVTGGPYNGEQRDEELHADMSQETARTRQILRYQHNAYESPVSVSYNQRFDNIDYEFGATFNSKFRLSTRFGHRSQFSIFDVPVSGTGGDSGAYHPPTRGDVNNVYSVTSISYQPWQRFALDLSGNVDQQRSAGVTTDARVASGAARLEVVRGLSINAVGSYGDRGQVVGDVPITVLTRSGLAGATYRAGVRWLQGSIGYSAGIGTNTTPEGQIGSTKSWSGQSSLSLSIKGVGLGGGYERSQNRDDILDFGNFSLERTHAAFNTQAGRFQLNASAERSLVDRGRGATFSTNLQRTFTGSVSLRIARDSQLTANAGGFQNDGTYGRDRALFTGVGLEAQLAKPLHLSAWIRRGNMVATETHLDQQTLYGFAQLEYKLRQFNLALEYRNNQQNLITGDLTRPYDFRGHQVMVRISRRFGIRV